MKGSEIVEIDNKSIKLKDRLGLFSTTFYDRIQNYNVPDNLKI